MTKHGKNEWAEAKRRCRLSAEHAAMAKELGVNPLSLIKNIPNKSQGWKVPVRDRVWELYRKRFGNRRASPPRTGARAAALCPAKQAAPAEEQFGTAGAWEDVPCSFHA